MTTRVRCATFLLLFAAACAGAGGAGGTAGGAQGAPRGKQSRFKQVDMKLPAPASIEDVALRAKLNDAGTHISRAQQAQESGNMDQARAEYAFGADTYASALETSPASEWRMPIAFRTAQMYLFAGKHEAAAKMAERVSNDPEANATSKAMAAHLGAAAWQAVAVQQVKAGQLEPVRLATAEQRKGKKLEPRPVPGAWKRFIDLTDVYIGSADADPDLKKPPAERSIQSTPAQLALIAAEVQYAFDNMEESQKRFESLIERWPAEEGVTDDAVPLYLETFQVLGDAEGYRSALSRLKQKYDAALADAEKANDAQRKATISKVRERLARLEAGAGFDRASALLAQGKAKEAAEAFEGIASAHAGSPDAALALYNASVAWTKADQPEKAAAAAKTILEKHPDSKVAPTAMLSLASSESRRNQHKEAARLYSEYLTRFPDQPNRCLALQNVGYEHDVLGDKAEAAARYFAFGTDASCAKEDPNAAAKALYRSGRLYQEAKQRTKATQSFVAATQVKGVTDEVAKSQVAEAKKLAKVK